MVGEGEPAHDDHIEGKGNQERPGAGKGDLGADDPVQDLAPRVRAADGPKLVVVGR